jgi:hypothetical protein
MPSGKSIEFLNSLVSIDLLCLFKVINHQQTQICAVSNFHLPCENEKKIIYKLELIK